jgi:hypothetical protein
MPGTQSAAFAELKKDELDFGTSLIDGPYAQTNFRYVLRQAKASAGRHDVMIVDFVRYFVSYEAPAGFVASPIYDGRRKIEVRESSKSTLRFPKWTIFCALGAINRLRSSR